MFNVEWVDLNGDGVKDLLVTSQGDSGSGKVVKNGLTEIDRAVRIV